MASKSTEGWLPALGTEEGGAGEEGGVSGRRPGRSRLEEDEGLRRRKARGGGRRVGAEAAGSVRGGRCVGGGELGEEEVGARRPESWGRRREAGELGEEEGGVGAEAAGRPRVGLVREEGSRRRRVGGGGGQGARRPEMGRAHGGRRRGGRRRRGGVREMERRTRGRWGILDRAGCLVPTPT